MREFFGEREREGKRKIESETEKEQQAVLPVHDADAAGLYESLREARGQIDPPRRRSVSRGEPAEGTTAKKDAPVHLRPTRPMAVDLADRRMRHFRKPFTTYFCCNKISPTSKQSDVTHFESKIFIL
ncbi:hypothetical protein ALC60_02655 [Trachymyrmex zeteki]|uniref:Uncharacterized protein n=1 Tax=Mycetomoellerius zeteki TaxID=64791 RepID=A0A151XCZ5_9HYME|nr:hypothetical protein ALC60_02655 [Trachymyrmex zeteki]